MGFILGTVCPRCRYLNKWEDLICCKCMSPLGKTVPTVLKEVQIFHINRGGRGLIYSSDATFSLSIGRRGCDIVFEKDRYLSPVHARIENSIEGLRIVDAGSYNGIFIKINRSQIIRPSDVFICGSQLLKFLGVLSGLTPYVLPDSTLFYGSSLPTKEYLMIQQVLSSGKMGNLYLRSAPLTIGREKADIVFFEDRFLSATHCSISYSEANIFVLNDLDSANGVFLKVRGSGELKNGDIILIGQDLLMIKIIEKKV